MHQDEARQDEEEIDEKLEPLEHVRRRGQERPEMIFEMIEDDAARREKTIGVERPIAVRAGDSLRRHRRVLARGPANLTERARPVGTHEGALDERVKHKTDAQHSDEV